MSLLDLTFEKFCSISCFPLRKQLPSKEPEVSYWILRGTWEIKREIQAASVLNGMRFWESPASNILSQPIQRRRNEESLETAAQGEELWEKWNGITLGHVAFQGSYGNWNEVLNVPPPMAPRPLTPASPAQWHSSMKPVFLTFRAIYISTENGGLLFLYSFTGLSFAECASGLFQSESYSFFFQRLARWPLALRGFAAFLPSGHSSLMTLISLHCNYCLLVLPLLPSSD